MPQAFRETAQKPNSDETLTGLLQKGRFRSAAQAAANELRTAVDPADYSAIFSLLYTRLVCLCVLNYYFEAAQEAKALQDFNGPFYRDSSTGIHVAPWELRMVTVRLQAIGLGDWRRGMTAYYEMARECRWHHGRSKDTTTKGIWKQRLADLGVQVAQGLVEMGDMDGAARHLQSLLWRGDASTSPILLMRLGIIQIRMGDVPAARYWLSQISEDKEEAVPFKTLEALTAMAEGNFDIAADYWHHLADRDGIGSRMLYLQNQAVCLVYSGEVSKVAMHDISYDTFLIY